MIRDNDNKIKKHGDRRLEILEHFQEVLKEEGIEGVSFAKIAKRMDVNPSLLLHYFPNKDNMILALVDFIFEKYETLGARKVKEVANPRERLDLLVDMVFGIDWISLVDSSVFYCCYYLSFKNPQVKERMQQMYIRFREQILKELQLCQKEGLLTQVDPEVGADFIVSLVEGLAFTRNVSGGTTHYLTVGERFKTLVLGLLKNDPEKTALNSLDELAQFKSQAGRLAQGLETDLALLKKKIDFL